MRIFQRNRGGPDTSGQHPIAKTLELLLLGLLYFIFADLGLKLASIHPSASPVWPATGLALASVLLRGTRVWPAIFAGAFAANLVSSNAMSISLGIAIGNTLEAVVGGYLVRRFAGGRAAFDLPGRVLRYAGLGIPSTAISAFIGVGSLCLGGRAAWANATPIALTWWLGDFGGYLLVGPLLVLLGTKFSPGWNRVRIAEAVAIGLVVTLVNGWVFGSQFPLPGQHFPLSFAAVPPILWAAFRFHSHGAAAAVVLSAVMSSWGTARGIGPFAVTEQNAALLVSQTFMSMMAISGLLLGSAMHERMRIEQRLRVAGRRLGLRFFARQVDLARAVEALDRAQTDLIRINGELEERVRTRTTELERSNQELERFAYAAAHDLLQPLRTVTWYTELLRDRISAADREDAQAMVGQIDDCTRWMKSTIDGLLAYSRVGESFPPLEAVDASRALDRALRNLAPRILEAGAFIDHRPLPLVQGNENLLTQVFQNLIDNAVKFRGDDSPHVQIAARRCEDEWEFSIRDNGIGIPAVHLENVFELLGRFRSRTGGGAGIGLATSRRIVERLGGRMWACSGPQVGSIFYFTLAAAARHRPDRHDEATMAHDSHTNPGNPDDPTASGDSRAPAPDRDTAPAGATRRPRRSATARVQD